MNKDFTVSIYIKLLSILKNAGFSFQTYVDFSNNPQPKSIILRHDVDARPEHSLAFARIQLEMGIRGTYYFRMVPQSFDTSIIKEIAAMGHEIGYHYEDMDLAGGDPDKAIKLFEKHLARLREIADISTICMHGSPLSRYDNKDLWKHHSYKDYDIIAEPYFDLDFSRVLYLTDTGRRWEGDKVSMRDRPADDSINQAMKEKRSLSESYHFRKTDDIIRACEKAQLPDQIMFTFHPQRWTDSSLLWYQELITQNIKNAAKYVLKGWRGR